ncbi:MAG: hypothetical protein D6805_05375 [Planctomycetota bacterium]|nr:MAG: hypothetical protein D6805_05375 [Planctomycetota bacterium]
MNRYRYFGLMLGLLAGVFLGSCGRSSPSVQAPSEKSELERGEEELADTDPEPSEEPVVQDTLSPRLSKPRVIHPQPDMSDLRDQLWLQFCKYQHRRRLRDLLEVFQRLSYLYVLVGEGEELFWGKKKHRLQENLVPVFTDREKALLYKRRFTPLQRKFAVLVDFSPREAMETLMGAQRLYQVWNGKKIFAQKAWFNPLSSGEVYVPLGYIQRHVLLRKAFEQRKRIYVLRYRRGKRFYTAPFTVSGRGMLYIPAFDKKAYAQKFLYQTSQRRKLEIYAFPGGEKVVRFFRAVVASQGLHRRIRGKKVYVGAVGLNPNTEEQRAILLKDLAENLRFWDFYGKIPTYYFFYNSKRKVVLTGFDPRPRYEWRAVIPAFTQAHFARYYRSKVGERYLVRRWKVETFIKRVLERARERLTAGGKRQLPLRWVWFNPQIPLLEYDLPIGVLRQLKRLWKR